MGFFSDLWRSLQSPEVGWQSVRAKTLLSLCERIEQTAVHLLVVRPFDGPTPEAIDMGRLVSQAGVLGPLEAIADLIKKDDPLGQFTKRLILPLGQSELEQTIGLMQVWMIRRSVGIYVEQLVEPSVPQHLKEIATEYLDYFSNHAGLCIEYFPRSVYGMSEDPGRLNWDPIENMLNPFMNTLYEKFAAIARINPSNEQAMLGWNAICGHCWARFFELCELRNQLKGYVAIQHRAATDSL